MSPVAMFLKSEETDRESLQEKWERVSFFMKVKTILTYLLNDVMLLSWSLFSTSEFATLF